MATISAPLSCTLLLLLATALPAQHSGRTLSVDASNSRIYVVTHRTGLLSFLGHQHAVLAPRWTAALCWSAPAHTGSRAELVIDTRALEIDADSARVLAGLRGGPSPQQRAQIQRKLHDEKNLASQLYPELRFRSSSIRATGDTLVVLGALTIRDRTREVQIPIIVEERGAGVFWMSGTVRVRQTDFGIRPESIAGVVKVADAVDIHVALLAALTSDSC